MKLIYNTKLILRDKIVESAVLFSEQIEKVYYDFTKTKLTKIKKEKKGLEIIDGQNNFLSPGFIDIHVHGSGGYDTMDASDEALVNIKRSLIKSGVTSFLASTMTMPIEDIKKALLLLKNYLDKDSIDKKSDGMAEIIGVHLEGPFISKEFKGCHSSQEIISPDFKLLEEYSEIIKMITFAPELSGGTEFIKYLRENNILAAAGHSGARYDDIISALPLGLSHVTHLFNAMEQLHHRKPGLIGAAFTTNMTVELIADFIHIHPAIIKMVLQAKDLDQIILVSDSMKAASLGDGEYDIAGQKVIVKEGAARLDNGQLAGSVLTIDQAIRNIKKISDIPLEKIINMATYNPARLLGLKDEIGSIKKGNKADFVLLDQDLEVLKVFKQGKVAYSKE